MCGVPFVHMFWKESWNSFRFPFFVHSLHPIPEKARAFSRKFLTGKIGRIRIFSKILDNGKPAKPVISCQSYIVLTFDIHLSALFRPHFPFLSAAPFRLRDQRQYCNPPSSVDSNSHFLCSTEQTSKIYNRRPKYKNGHKGC